MDLNSPNTSIMANRIPPIPASLCLSARAPLRLPPPRPNPPILNTPPPPPIKMVDRRSCRNPIMLTKNDPNTMCVLSIRNTDRKLSGVLNTSMVSFSCNSSASSYSSLVNGRKVMKGRRKRERVSKHRVGTGEGAHSKAFKKILTGRQDRQIRGAHPSTSTKVASWRIRRQRLPLQRRPMSAQIASMDGPGTAQSSFCGTRTSICRCHTCNDFLAWDSSLARYSD